jgi:hypothetical protein
MDFATLAAAQNYVDKTAQSLGAVKGAPCTIKSITEGEDGSTIVFSWTGADGTEQTRSTFLHRGPQGEPGKKGSDGFSPDVKVSEINGGHRVTITDAKGTYTFDVMDGANGTGCTVEVDAEGNAIIK